LKLKEFESAEEIERAMDKDISLLSKVVWALTQALLHQQLFVLFIPCSLAR
jgi:hypothetical protein